MKETTYLISGAPELTIALVSDLHGEDPEPVLCSLKNRRPDVIALAGDMTTYKRDPSGKAVRIDMDRFLPLAGSLSAIAPAFFSLGNHEWMISQEEIAQIEETGIKVPDNTWVKLKKHAFRSAEEESPVLIGGLTSSAVSDYRKAPGKNPWPASSKPETALTGWLDRFEQQPGYKILLCHHPEYWPMLRSRRIDLIMSGHAHGGQIRLFGRGLFAPGQGVFPRYTSGLYQGKYGVLAVSRGLANTARPVPRLFNEIEIVYLCAQPDSC